MTLVTILGLQQSGKTYTTTNEILPLFGPYSVVYDPNDEYIGCKRYVPRYTDDRRRVAELHGFLSRLVRKNIQTREAVEKGAKPRKNRLRCVVFDEADLIAPARSNIDGALRDLLVKRAHWQIDVVMIARRPTDLSAYVMDTSDYLIVYKQTGYNALRTLRALKLDSDTDVKALDYSKREFLLFDRERSYTRHSPENYPDWEKLFDNLPQ